MCNQCKLHACAFVRIFLIYSALTTWWKKYYVLVVSTFHVNWPYKQNDIIPPFSALSGSFLVDAHHLIMATEDKKAETDSKPPVVPSASASQSKVWLSCYVWFLGLIEANVKRLWKSLCVGFVLKWPHSRGAFWQLLFPLWLTVRACQTELQSEIHTSGPH